jgi:large subunit ribosomal protein L1
MSRRTIFDRRANMEKKEIIDTIKKVRKISKKRNFNQSFDLIINIKGLDLKKNENKIDDYVELHNSKGKKVRVCAFVGSELESEAKKVCDKTIREDEFKKLDKKEVKKLCSEYDYFIAQANIMPKVAASFGKILGPKGKMPDPKAGCVVPPKANLKPLYDKLQKLVKLTTKKGPSVKAMVGSEDMKDEDVADNVHLAYTHFMHMLPQRENNIKNVIIKLTMSKPLKIGEEIPEDLDNGEDDKKEETKSKEVEK